MELKSIEYCPFCNRLFKYGPITCDKCEGIFCDRCDDRFEWDDKLCPDCARVRLMKRVDEDKTGKCPYCLKIISTNEGSSTRHFD